MEPFASQFRPKSLDEFVGQEHLVGKNGSMRHYFDKNKFPSMIFWGPPGCGKTSLAYVISQRLGNDFFALSAVNSGKKKLLEVVKIAKLNKQYNKQTILFLDEIHRWNKAQQDALLPYVEKGIITLIGATTENPSFSLNTALLSRCSVFVFEPLSEKHILKILQNGLKNLNKENIFQQSALKKIAKVVNGDARQAINIVENAINYLEEHPKKQVIETEDLEGIINVMLHYDQSGDQHYDLISALHKSIRSSDANAALYWLTRMIEGGEDPLYIARRLIRIASEDIGISDPQALIIATSAYTACEKIGLPECDLSLAEAVVYLCNAPKDNKLYVSMNKMKDLVKKSGSLPVPLHLRNAPTKLMKELGYGKGYVYDHDVKGKKSGQQCLPDKIKNVKIWEEIE